MASPNSRWVSVFYCILPVLDIQSPSPLQQQDVICGRQRENFHHSGNKYFRELIQKNIGPYLGSNTKLEKGEAIADITKLVQDNSPDGGFVKLDSKTGRWFRIKESEARDKVGHAIRKAVQRMEDAQPKLYSRLKKEFTEKAAAAKAEEREEGGDAALESDDNQQKKPKASSKTSRKRKSTSSAVAIEQLPQPDPIRDAALPVHQQQRMGILPGLSSPALMGQMRGLPASLPGALSSLNQFRPGLSIDQTNLLAQSLRGTPTSSLLQANYNPLLALHIQGQQQRSQDDLALIRALQQQEEAKIRREIEYTAQRNLPIYDPGVQLRVASTAAANPLAGSASQQLPSQLAPLGAGLTSQGALDLSSQLSDLLKKQQNKDEDLTKK